ncbi:MAG TPA: glycosyltransferase family 92 protein [Solirubrobacterales bacterium]|nr:glycosyltransferase family 92 protein [Solirubrobacterales bacterium]
MHYLAVCAIYRNEGPYLREWIEFHRLVGVEKFFLYDNRSTDDHRDQLAPYVADGTVEVLPWPDEPGQITAYAHCLATHRDEARWIAFIDLDEFLFSPTLAPLPEILADYEQHPAVVANWAVYGSSGHRTPPAGLVIENYLWRLPDHRRRNLVLKSIVDPRRTLHSAGVNPHAFIYEGGFAVNELHHPVDRKPLGETDEVSFARLRINHYYIKSQEQWEAKRAAAMANSGRSRQQPPEQAERYSVRDETITAYAPAVRDALAAVPSY